MLCVPSAQEGRRPAGTSGTLAPVLSGWAASGQSPSQCLQRCLLPGLSAPKSAPPSSGERRQQRPGAQTAVRPPGVRQPQGGSGWADPGEVSGARGLLVGSLSPQGMSGVCWNPGLAGHRRSLCSQASPGAAWGRTLAHGALIPSPVQCWAVEPCEVSAGAWLRLGSSQPAPRAARPPEGEAERRRGGPTVRGGAGGCGPGAGPSRAGPGRLGGAGPAGVGGRVVRTTDRLPVSGAQPSAASPAQGTGPGRARSKVTATGWALGAARGVPSRVRDAQVLRKVESWYWAEGAWERDPGGGPASACPLHLPLPPSAAQLRAPGSPCLARGRQSFPL